MEWQLQAWFPRNCRWKISIGLEMASWMVDICCPLCKSADKINMTTLGKKGPSGLPTFSYIVHFWWFWGYQKWHLWCPKQKTETTFIDLITPLNQGKITFWPLKIGTLAILHIFALFWECKTGIFFKMDAVAQFPSKWSNFLGEVLGKPHSETELTNKKWLCWIKLFILWKKQSKHI